MVVAKPQAAFLRCARMRARPAGPAQSSALHDFARSGPTKEAHRRAFYRSGGLQRSVAGQGHARFVRVTLPRGASDQGKRTEPGSFRSLTPRGPIRGGVGGPIRGGVGGPLWGPIRGVQRGREIAGERSGEPFGIVPANSTTGMALGPKSASARPGPCTRPRSADALTRREYHPARQAAGVKLVRPRPPAPASRDGPGVSWRPAGAPA
jgi:hypothetical protein